MTRIVVDSRGRVCPGPVLDLFKAYRGAADGDEVELLATDPAAPSDIRVWAVQHASKVLEITKAHEGHTRILVRLSK